MKSKTEHLIELTDAALSADYTRVRRAAGAIARDLAKAGDPEAAKQLQALVRKRGVPLRASGYMEALPVDAKSRLPLVDEHSWPTSPLFLNEEAHAALRDFLDDTRSLDQLSAKGLSSRLCLLVSGPPGTGKTLLAGHVAAQLGRPFYVVRLDAMISSLLGDTAKNIRAIFDFAPTKGAVLFLDEMDAVAKLRDDRHELGEIKRVVNTLIQGLDSLGSDAIVVAATNHPHLLDSAIWRRFPYKISLDLPELSVREDLWRHFLFADADDHAAGLLALISEGLTGADIETIALTARRHAVLDRREPDVGAVAFSALRSARGKSILPQRQPLSADHKRELAVALQQDHRINGADIGRLLGVTRQSVYGYLRGEDRDG